MNWTFDASATPRVWFNESAGMELEQALSALEADGVETFKHPFEKLFYEIGMSVVHREPGRFRLLLEFIVSRASQYAQKLGKTPVQVIEAWENERNYWWANYYQDANQPDPSGALTLEEWMDKATSLFGEDVNAWTAVCPKCKRHQTCGQVVALGGTHNDAFFNCKGRFDSNDKVCNYTLGGLFTLDHTAVIHPDGRITKAFKFYEPGAK